MNVETQKVSKMHMDFEDSDRFYEMEESKISASQVEIIEQLYDPNLAPENKSQKENRQAQIDFYNYQMQNPELSSSGEEEDRESQKFYEVQKIPSQIAIQSSEPKALYPAQQRSNASPERQHAVETYVQQSHSESSSTDQVNQTPNFSTKFDG